MYPQRNANKLKFWQGRSIGAIVGLTAIAGAVAGLSPLAQAHKTQVAGDIAGIWHIDPNHNPQAGKPARVWVALTRRGGQIVPLSQTNCQMRVFNRPRRPADQPILQPALTAINAERYRGIPGTNITFPRIGLYQLELNCSPRKAGAFQPFRLTYEVTVGR